MITHFLPTKLRGAWTSMERNYRMSLAENLKAALHDGDSEAVNDAYTAAVDAILLTPAGSLPDLRLKIEVMREHEVEDGWWCAKEAIALLAIDAARLIDPTREGRDAWQAPKPATGTVFAEKFAAWEAARKARQDFDDANRPTAKGLSPEMQAFEFALSPYHDACLDTAMAVIKSPAPDVAALVCKQRVFYAEEMQQCSDTSSEAMTVLFADAVRFAGGTA